ncbi:MAG TPA: hypothetical protein VK936_13535, partial [Longimicrobiales bacterium]|nr:hypothetical protein [Longimicrobiales bacterium]
MTPPGRPLQVRALQVTILAAVAWGIYRILAPDLRRLEWADVTRWRPEPAPLLASFALLVAVYIAHALLWRRIMADLGIGRPARSTIIRVYFL